MLPTPGKVKLMFGNIAEAAITINNQTVKIAPGIGGPKSPDGPTLELPPGKYKYALKVAGRPARSAELEVAANDFWARRATRAGGKLA